MKNERFHSYKENASQGLLTFFSKEEYRFIDKYLVQKENIHKAEVKNN